MKLFNFPIESFIRLLTGDTEQLCFLFFQNKERHGIHADESGDSLHRLGHAVCGQAKECACAPLAVVQHIVRGLIAKLGVLSMNQAASSFRRLK